MDEESTKIVETKNIDKKTKIKVLLLNIISFGFFSKYLKKQVIKKETNKNEEIKVSTKIPFDFLLLIDYLGGIINIKKTTPTVNSISVGVADKTLIKKEEIKKLGAKGMMVSSNNISMIFGDFTTLLSEKMNASIDAYELEKKKNGI